MRVSMEDVASSRIHHGRIADGCAGDGEELALSLAESGAVASEDGVVSLRQHADEAVGIGEFCGGDAILRRWPLDCP